MRGLGGLKRAGEDEDLLFTQCLGGKVGDILRADRFLGLHNRQFAEQVRAFSVNRDDFGRYQLNSYVWVAISTARSYLP